MEIFNLKFLWKTDQERVFCDGYEGKEDFLDHKNIGWKNHPNFNFFKEVSPWFLSKNGDFFIFSFYAKRDQEKVFFGDSERKEAFLDKKNIG